MYETIDELQVQRSLSARAASPSFERTARQAIESAFKRLFETKNLYQKELVDLALLVTELGREAPKVTPSEIPALHREARMRRWRVANHHQGDDRSTAEILRYANQGCDPLGTPDDDRTLYFLAP